MKNKEENNSKVKELYEQYKKDGAIMLDKYKHNKISSIEFDNWINNMRIRSKI